MSTIFLQMVWCQLGKLVLSHILSAQLWLGFCSLILMIETMVILSAHIIPSLVSMIPPFASTTSKHTLVSYHSIKGLAEEKIWTHGECIQFATLGPGTLIIWEVGFTSKDPPREVEFLPTPNNFNPNYFIFLPTFSRLAFVNEGVSVWDCQHSKFLLDSVDIFGPTNPTFSSDGCFFACGTDGPDIYLWKDSPTGYILHQIFTSSIATSWKPFISPDGQSIAAAEADIIELWHVTDQTITPSSVPVPTPWYDKNFILGFSPGGSLAAVVRWAENTVTVLNLKSGAPQLVIDTGMKVSGLRMTENTVVIAGDGKVVVWNLPMGDQVPNARANIGDGNQIITYDYSPFPEWTGTPLVSISPDFSCIAVFNHSHTSTPYLSIYDMFTGKYLAGAKPQIDTLWFTLDGNEVWGGNQGSLHGWKFIKDSESNDHILEHVGETGGPVRECAWKSSCGHKVIEDGWILSSSGKHLLWLPHHWQLREWCSMWHGQFLAFLHHTLPDVVILELLEE